MSIATILVDALKDRLSPAEESEILAEFEVIERALGIGGSKTYGALVIGAAEGIKVFDTEAGKVAIDLHPKGYFSIYEKDTLMVRLGNLKGEYGTDVKRYGIGIGDYSSGNYLSYNAEAADTFIIKGGGGHLVINKDGLNFWVDSTYESHRIEWFYWDSPNNRKLGDVYGHYGGAGDAITWVGADKNTGDPWTYAQVVLQASDYSQEPDKFVRLFVSTSGTITADCDILHLPSGDAYSEVFQEYSDYSTITGWSSYTSKYIRYKTWGKLMFVEYFISGTSNLQTTTFTLPHAVASNPPISKVEHFQDNGTWGWGRIYIAASGSTVSLYFGTGSGSTWTASGTKTVRGQFFCQIA